MIGTSAAIGDGGPATSAPLGSVGGLVVDRDGNVIVADTLLHRVHKIITSTGRIQSIAGTGAATSQGPTTGAAASVPFGVPRALSADRNGNTLVLDRSGISKITPAGQTSLVLRNLNLGNSLAVDADGNIYFIEVPTRIIRKVDASGSLSTTFAGSAYGYGDATFQGDNGPANLARLAQPSAIALDAKGALFIADTYNYRIRKVSGGIITTIAGTGIEGESGDGGPATKATLAAILYLALDNAGNVYLSDGQTIRRITPDGLINRLAGVATSLDITALAVDVAGVLYFGDGEFVRRWNPATSTVSTVAGNSTLQAGSVPVQSALLVNPTSVAVDSGGNVYIAETGRHRIRKLTPQGVVSIVAGTGAKGYSGDQGPGVQAQLNNPIGLKVSRTDEVYFADVGNRRIRKLSADGKISTIAGDGTYGSAGDDGGLAINAQFGNLTAIAVDSQGNIYVTDDQIARIRKVATNGKISTIAGGLSGFGIGSMAVDSVGSLYFAQFDLIRKIDPNGVISDVAGVDEIVSSSCCVAGSNPLGIPIPQPRSLAVGKSGTLYFSHSSSGVAIITPESQLFGYVGPDDPYKLPPSGFSGDGDAPKKAVLSDVLGIAVDSGENLYIVDSGNNRIRRVTRSEITPGGVVNAFSYAGGAVAPGEIVTVFGCNLGPATLTGAQLDKAGLLDTKVAGTQLLVDGTPAPLIYASSNSISAVVPYSASGKSSGLIEIVAGDLHTPLLPISITDAAPGLVSLDGSGKNSAVAFNVDGLNSADHPAARGSVIVLYGTGEGQTNPPGVDGKITGPDLVKPILPVTVSIGGKQANVLYAGAVPGVVAGLLQINVVVPTDIEPDPKSAVIVSVGGKPSQLGLTVSVQ